MISKTDILSILMDMKDKGYEVDNEIRKLYSSSNSIPEIIKFINNNRNIDIRQFYEKLRHNYNKKKSDLYLNIVKEIDNPEEVLTTLAAYNLQGLLFAKKIDDKEMFYRNARLEEVTRVLNNYYKTFDISSCNLLLSLIKSDIKLFEEMLKEE